MGEKFFWEIGNDLGIGIGILVLEKNNKHMDSMEYSL
jgi:hypothetical protein